MSETGVEEILDSLGGEEKLVMLMADRFSPYLYSRLAIMCRLYCKVYAEEFRTFFGYNGKSDTLPVLIRLKDKGLIGSTYQHQTGHTLTPDGLTVSAGLFREIERKNKDIPSHILKVKATVNVFTDNEVESLFESIVQDYYEFQSRSSA